MQTRGIVVALSVVLVTACSSTELTPPASPSSTDNPGQCRLFDGETVTNLAWSPDGAFLAVESQDAIGQDRLDHVRRLEIGSGVLQEVAANRQMWGAASPRDDGMVVWSEFVDKGPIVRVLLGDGSDEPRELFRTQHLVLLTTTAEGLVYGVSTNDGSNLELRTRDSSGGERVTTVRSIPAAAWVDNDGRTMLFMDNLDRTARFSILEDGRERVLGEVPDFPVLHGLTSNGDGVIYSHLDQELRFDGLFVLPLSGDEPEKLHPDPTVGSIGPLDLSPIGLVAWAGWNDPSASSFCIADASLLGL